MLKSKLWLFPLAYVLFFLTEAIADVFYSEVSLHKKFFLLEQSFLVLFVLAVIKSYRKKTNVHWLAVGVGFLIIFYAGDVRFRTYILAQSFRIKLNPRIFSQCVKNAISISGGGAIGVCEYTQLQAIGTELGINTSYIVKSIIYDSTDQILINETQRSREWYQSAYVLRKMVPFGRIGHRTEKLIGHYYYVVFNTDLETKPEYYKQ